jgi:hypothetical protein
VGTWISKLLRWVSWAICLIVVASFGIFALGQTSSASSHQQKEVAGEAAADTPLAQNESSHDSSVHKAIDEASSKLTSPFSGVTAGSSSEWVIRGVDVLLALVIYGFGLGFLARVIRMRT